LIHRQLTTNHRLTYILTLPGTYYGYFPAAFTRRLQLHVNSCIVESSHARKNRRTSLGHPLFLLAFQRLAPFEQALALHAQKPHGTFYRHSSAKTKCHQCTNAPSRHPPPIRPDAQPSPHHHTTITARPTSPLSSLATSHDSTPSVRVGRSVHGQEVRVATRSLPAQPCPCPPIYLTPLYLLLPPSQNPKSTIILELSSHLRVSRSGSVSLSFVQSNCKLPPASDLHLSPSVGCSEILLWRNCHVLRTWQSTPSTAIMAFALALWRISSETFATFTRSVVS
jgi:hypothetical protein